MLLISKKNGKSTIAAGIMLTALILNWRHNAELLILAPTLEVREEQLRSGQGAWSTPTRSSTQLLHVVEHQRLIRHRVNEAELKVVAADSDTASGKKAGFVLVEELWLFGKKPKSAAMLREATGGLAARPEGFVLYITTHSATNRRRACSKRSWSTSAMCATARSRIRPRWRCSTSGPRRCSRPRAISTQRTST